MKLIFFLIATLVSLSLLSPLAIFAEDDGFSLNIEPVSYTALTIPGQVNNKITNLITANSQVTVYPMIFDWDKEKDEFHYTHSWINFLNKKVVFGNGHDYFPINWTVTAPNDAESGEYYKIAAFASQPFITEESDNPPIIIGAPVILQVAAGASTQLYSKITLESFHSFFNPFIASQDFRFKLRNEGNISAIPIGYITIKNYKEQFIETLEFNEQNISIFPNTTYDFEVKFRSSEPLIGQLKAEVWLGYKNSVEEVNPQMVSSVNFLYVSPDLLLAILISLFFVILINWFFSKIPVKIIKLRYRHLGHLLIFITVLSSTVFYMYKDIKRSEKTLGEKKELQVTAQVRESIGLKVIRRNGQMVIRYTGNQPKPGWKLYSLRGSKGKLLMSNSDNHSLNKEIVLSKTDSRFPILLLTDSF